MGFGWRRAFCTTVPRETDSGTVSRENVTGGGGNGGDATAATPKSGGRFGFFRNSYSNPSSPRVSFQPVSSPELRCQTTASTVPAPLSPLPNSRSIFQRSTNSTPPRSPSAFSLIKFSLRLHTSRCGLCLQSVKRGRGVAIFTAECSHSFHFPCVGDYVKRQGSLACPVCGVMWKEIPVLSVNDQNQNQNHNPNPQFAEEEEEDERRGKLVTRPMNDVMEEKRNELQKHNLLRSDLKVYDDDEPLTPLTPNARFDPILESDENCDEDCTEEFRGFCINGGSNSPIDVHSRDIEVRLLPEVAVVSSSRSHETYTAVLNVKPPAGPEKSQRRAPIDLVTVVDVTGKMSIQKLHSMKRAMRIIVSSLSSSDRLSVVAFSSYSKRLLPLRRMTTKGRRAARRLIEAMAVLEGSSSANDAVKKAAKVLEDRREKNTAASVIILSDVHHESSLVSPTRHRHSQLDVSVHRLKLAVTDDHTMAKTVGSLLNVVVQDLQLQLGFVSGGAPAEITAVYSYAPRPAALGSGTIRIGELYSNEERELLLELKIPSSAVRAHQVLSVRCRYRESVTQETFYGREQTLPLPYPHTVRSSSLNIQRLRNLFLTARALAESRRLTERNDFIGAYHTLVSARALIHQSATGNDFAASLEAELSELQSRRKLEITAYLDERGEPLTPTSAWRVAEKLAKVAIMRKSLNRVSDLHGFEDARF